MSPELAEWVDKRDHPEKYEKKTEEEPEQESEDIQQQAEPEIKQSLVQKEQKIEEKQVISAETVDFSKPIDKMMSYINDISKEHEGSADRK